MLCSPFSSNPLQLLDIVLMIQVMNSKHCFPDLLVETTQFILTHWQHEG